MTHTTIRLVARFVLPLAWLAAGNFPASAEEQDDIQSAAALIDRHIFERLDEAQVTPAAPASDAEFLRRVWLDLAGAIPSASRARRFQADTDPDKRTQEVHQLLERTGYVSHFTTYWRNVLLPELKSDEQVQQLLPGFEAWLQQHLAKNTPYDQWVYEAINTPLARRGRDQQVRLRGAERSAIAFFQAKEIAPENLAAATSRIFLGIRIECAQCHDHPFDDWSQKQFWSYASFFAGIERQGDDGIFGRVQEIFDRRELLIPETTTVVQAGYLDGTQPQWRRGIGSRKILADWITSEKNPYFARMAVNRIWGKFFGVGLVDPVDDFTAHNACSHPELLAALSQRLVQHDFDLKFLIRAITTSRAYQLSSKMPDAPQSQRAERAADPQSFAAMSVKGLTPDQLLDSLAEATGMHDYFGNGTTNGGRMSPRSELLELFANDTDPVTRQQTSILQSLALMNGRFMADVVDPRQCPTLAGAINARLNTREQIESLFFATLSRAPSEQEWQHFVQYVDSNRASQDPSRALGDVFWALLNSAEFSTNH